MLRILLGSMCLYCLVEKMRLWANDKHRERDAKAQLGEREVMSEFRFVCSCGLHKNDPRNHTKSHEQNCFVWLRGSFSNAGRSLKVRKLRHYREGGSQNNKEAGRGPPLLRSQIPDRKFKQLPIRTRLRSRHALHRDRQSAIGALRQRDELSIRTNRIKHRIDARFHHFFRADGIVALVLIEVPPE